MSVAPPQTANPPNTTGPGAYPAASAAVRAKIDASAQKFETQFLSVMLGHMFDGVSTPAPFGGGQGEAMFKSFLTDAFAEAIAHHGGVGLSQAISKDMLKLQGLS